MSIAGDKSSNAVTAGDCPGSHRPSEFPSSPVQRLVSLHRRPAFRLVADFRREVITPQVQNPRPKDAIRAKLLVCDHAPEMCDHTRSSSRQKYPRRRLLYLPPRDSHRQENPVIKIEKDFGQVFTVRVSKRPGSPPRGHQPQSKRSDTRRCGFSLVQNLGPGA